MICGFLFPIIKVFRPHPRLCGRLIPENSGDKIPTQEETVVKIVTIFQSIYINGSPQNTFVPGIVQFAEQNGVFIAGDDFKSGQTKLKSVLFDFLVGAGIKPASIVSYNHLGNNDGRNLSAPQQFRSKEVRVLSPGRRVGGDERLLADLQE